MTPLNTFMQIVIGLTILLCVFLLYFGSLWQIVRASRIPESPKLHPGRAHLALVVLGLSFLVPAIMFGFNYYFSQDSWDRSYAYHRNQCDTQIASCESRIEEWNQWKDSGFSDVMENLDTFGGTDANSVLAWLTANVDSKIQEENGLIGKYSQDRKGMYYSRERMGDYLPGILLPAILYAIPCTLLGIGYVISVRKDIKRPGLVPAMFAGFTWPLFVFIALGGGFVFVLFSLQWWQALIVCFLLALAVFAAVAITVLVVYLKKK